MAHDTEGRIAGRDGTFKPVNIRGHMAALKLVDSVRTVFTKRGNVDGV